MVGAWSDSAIAILGGNELVTRRIEADWVMVQDCKFRAEAFLKRSLH
jgi:hypothetical protein